MEDDNCNSARCQGRGIDHEILVMAAKTPPLSLDVASVGRRIQELREANQKSQEEVANAIGSAASTVSRWERGRVAPAADQLVNLAHYFGTTVDYLLIGSRAAAVGAESEALREFKKTELGKIAADKGWLAELRRLNLPEGMETEIYRQVVVRLLDLRPSKKRSPAE